MITCKQYFRNPEWFMLHRAGIDVRVRGWSCMGGRAANSEDLAICLLELFSKNKSPGMDELATVIRRWRGNFSFVVHCGGDVWMGADMIRSMPLFYAKTAAGILVSDVYEWVADNLESCNLDLACAEEFLVSGFIYGNRCLHEQVNSLQAGELVCLSGKEEKTVRYFSFNMPVADDDESFDVGSLYSQLDELLLQAFKRMVQTVGDVRRWMVPLSGGYDSRIVVSYMKRMGIENVQCFTYGRTKNEEAELSRQVADALGYDWCFIEYGKADWQKQWLSNQAVSGLFYAFNGSSLPVFHYFANVNGLRECGVLNQGDVFVPGHSFDMLCGSHLREDLMGCNRFSRRGCSKLLQQKHASFWWDSKGQKRIRMRLQEFLAQHENNDPFNDMMSALEWFNWQERQAKFIVNSVRVYEHMGYRWRLPLWDYDLTYWWLKIPYHRRLHRKLFREAYEKTLVLPKLRGIPIFGESAQQQVPGNTIVKKWAKESSRLLREQPVARFLKSMWRRWVPPGAERSPLAFEEYFSSQADTVGALLSLEENGQDCWPADIVRYLNWRKKWPVSMAGGMPNALLAAYILKHYFCESVSDREGRPDIYTE